MLWNAENGTVSIGDTEMDYVSFGYGNEILIMLPGLSDGLTSVKGKALLLAFSYRLFFSKYKVYIFSRRNKLPEHYSIDDMARDQVEAMNQLGIRCASVLGASQGGMIAQAMAIHSADRIKKLIIAVSSPCANKMIQSVVPYWMELAKQGKHKELMSDTAEKSYSENYLKKNRKYLPLLSMFSKPKDYHRFLVNAEAILGFDETGELDRINCPTLIIGGRQDQIVGVNASIEMAEKIKGSQLYIYPEYGHAAYEEAKDFYSRVLDFLNENN